ncbi:c9orf32 [Histomonas meleagridis]|uniref:c9orf32 n=1 Tax=Histomonas meleagridis TaxID=135588 RepID=UPI003559C235|nr:c9orf32 [Histomonas meleagridis]KAH0802378.1 c9orf32 [Histomonas meleagridis]
MKQNEKTEIESLPRDPNMIFSEKGDQWYVESRFFWSTQQPTIESMIFGNEEYSIIDLRYTYNVLSLLQFEKKIKGGVVADCGGGIGRVSFQVLTHFFQSVDIVDPIPHFLFKAREHLEKVLSVDIIQKGLEEWNPSKAYDAFYIQWTMCYLTDRDLVSFLKRCSLSSSKDCIFIIKENIAGVELQTDKSQYEYYPERNSICRTYPHFCELFKKAGLVLEEYRIQPNWPSDFLSVAMFILRK